jgi:POT family proton-dependent oligopeptide transporter
MGWHAGFGLAGIAMLLGLVVYIWGQKYLTHVGNLEKVNEVDESSYGRLLRPS